MRREHESHPDEEDPELEQNLKTLQATVAQRDQQLTDAQRASSTAQR
jgi:hypothetical protein